MDRGSAKRRFLELFYRSQPQMMRKSLCGGRLGNNRQESMPNCSFQDETRSTKAAKAEVRTSRLQKKKQTQNELLIKNRRAQDSNNADGERGLKWGCEGGGGGVRD